MRLILALLLLSSTALAGGRGGNVQAFDPTLFPGANVYCLTATVAGKCPAGAFNATCNGIADDTTALRSFLAAGAAANPTKAVLYLPIGSRCNFGIVNNFVVDTNLNMPAGGFQYGAGIQNLVVWGYGASANAWGVLGESFGHNNTTTARIVTVAAGSPTVTLVTGGDASKFASGDTICVTGIQLQNGGFPQNFQFFEFRVITNIAGSVITLSSPLTYAYKSTWPVYAAGSSSTEDYGGPGTIYKMGPSWNTNAAIYGLGFVPTDPAGGIEIPIAGRTIAFYDIAFQQNAISDSGSGPAPSASESVWFFNSTASTLHNSAGYEIDKVISFMGMVNNSAHLFFQSASPANTLITNFTGSVSGTPLNATFRNATFPQPVNGSAVGLGPNCYGHGDSLVFDRVSVASARDNGCFALKTAFSYATGTFTISDANALSSTLNWGIPGKKYYFGRSFGGFVCNGGVSFTITDVTQGGGNTNYVTDLVGALPNPSCVTSVSGDTSLPYDRYIAYPAATITQKNSTGTDMTVFAAPP
jgi:hypothetical protein